MTPNLETDMELDRLRASLKHLKLDDSNYKVLKLLPLVYVAWSNGRMDAAQEERIIELAHNHFQIGRRGEELLRNWIDEQPSMEYIKEGLHDILLLAHAPDEWGFELDELQGLLSHAEQMAHLSASALNVESPVDEREKRALEDIATELDIDDGKIWSELLEELG